MAVKHATVQAEPAAVAPLVDPAASRSMALRLLRRLGPKATGQKFDERHELRPGTGERQLYRLLTGLRWGVTHAGPRPAEQVRETTEDRLWVLL